MKAEELQEAVAFERSDTSWDSDKIPDENLMIETCRGLLIRDEEDRTVRFAHHTVQQYLLSAPAITTEDGSHFLISPRSEAEAFVGQVCVTYLYFSDFETQVTLRTPDVHLEPLGVLKTGGPAMIPTVLGMGKSLLEIPYRLLGGRSTTVPLNIDYSKYLTLNTQKRPQVPSALMEKYRLLEYVIENWVDHTKELEPALDAKFRRLAMHKTLSFEFRPWGPNQHFGPYGCVSCSEPTAGKDLPFMSLFHYSAQVGHWRLMGSLVAEYCQHEVPFDETLSIACREGQDLIVRNLMNEIDFDISDGRAVNAATAAGHADILNYLLNFRQKAVNGGRKFPSYNIIAHASSLLNLAATNGHEKVIDIICNHGRRSDPQFSEAVHINKKHERTGHTALFSAVMKGHANIVRSLLARGAHVEADGNTAMHIAAEYRHLEILRMLIQDTTNADISKGFDLTHEAGETYTQTLLRVSDTEGETPLHKAARNGHTAVLALILKHQPQFARKRKAAGSYLDNYLDWGERTEGATSLHLASRGGHLDAVKILVAHGAKIEAQTLHQGWTALHFAAAHDHLDVVEFLVEQGANIEAQTRDSWTALNFAVAGRHKAMRVWILENGHNSGLRRHRSPLNFSPSSSPSTIALQPSIRSLQINSSLISRPLNRSFGRGSSAMSFFSLKKLAADSAVV